MVPNPSGRVVSVRAETPEERQAREEYERGSLAMALAPTLEVCRALLRGERVPVETLDQAQLARYGLRDPSAGIAGVDDTWSIRSRRPGAARVALDDLDEEAAG